MINMHNSEVTGLEAFALDTIFKFKIQRYLDYPLEHS